MRKKLNASLLAIALCGAALIHSPNPAQSQPKSPAKIYILDTANNVINEKNRVENVPVLVTLFSKGQPIRNTTIGNINSNFLPASVNWGDLPAGPIGIKLSILESGLPVPDGLDFLTSGRSFSSFFDSGRLRASSLN